MSMAKAVNNPPCPAIPALGEPLFHAAAVRGTMSPSERHELTTRMWEHLFLLMIEIVHAPRKIHDTNWRDYATLEDADRLVRAFFDDRPTVVICGHYGNFELSGYVLGILGFPTF